MASFKTYIFKILCSTALLSIFACSSDDDGGNDFSPKTTILIAGYEDINDDDYARLWENGIPQNLSNTQPNTRAKDVFVTGGGDVYMAINDYSNSPSRAIILKNGEQIFISEPESSATINSIFITNNDVYACGYIVRDNGGYPAYWKNGILTELGSNSGSARDIFVNNDDVYVCGGVFNQSLNNTDATYWKMV